VWPPLSEKEAKEYFELRNEIWMAGKSQSFMEKIVDVDGEHTPESDGRTLNVLGTFKVRFVFVHTVSRTSDFNRKSFRRTC
jgi:hypothetical protein